MEATYSSAPVQALGQSDAFLHFQEQLSRVAPIERPVLIIGERGTGKELAAARLHYLSPRWQGPLVTLNCAALAGSLLDAELFGHEAGAFTGASMRRKGRFENADTGTLFLDEIANLSREAQEKILRVVEYGAFDRVGGSQPVTVNVRVVGATNVDLPQRARAGAFKEDLLDRLSFEVLTVPPLRERKGDVELLTRHFAQRMAISLGFPEAPEFSAWAMAMLVAHDWPGNVRELKNVVERSVYRSGPGTVRQVAFDPFASPFRPVEQARPEAQGLRKEDAGARGGQVDLAVPLARAVRDLEERYLAEALAEARHNQKKAAALLGLTYHQFRGLYRRLGPGLDD
jgi:psp operon transcriptional activator